MIIAFASANDRIRLIAIEMKGAFGNEGALRIFGGRRDYHECFGNFSPLPEA